MGSCAGGGEIQFPSEFFMCLLSDAKEWRNNGACTIRKNLFITKPGSCNQFHMIQFLYFSSPNSAMVTKQLDNRGKKKREVKNLVHWMPMMPPMPPMASTTPMRSNSKNPVQVNPFHH